MPPPAPFPSDADALTALAERVARVYLAQRSSGCEVTRRSGLTLARNHDTPLIWDANFAFDVDPALAADGDAFARELDACFEDADHQKVVCGATVAPIVEARLAAAGFEAEHVLQMVLAGPLPPGPPPRGEVSIEATSSEHDWAELVRLQHANFTDEAARRGRDPFDIEVARQMVRSWRAKPGMHFWLARESGGRPCAYFASWVGQEGLGMIEYLFTEVEHRHRGIATALISHAVKDVRDAGASMVLIGAVVEDTPKQMYLDLGFRPVCITREWLRQGGERPSGAGPEDATGSR